MFKNIKILIIAFGVFMLSMSSASALTCKWSNGTTNVTVDTTAKTTIVEPSSNKSVSKSTVLEAAQSCQSYIYIIYNTADGSYHIYGDKSVEGYADYLSSVTQTAQVYSLPNVEVNTTTESSLDDNEIVSCGDLKSIPAKLPKITSTIVTVIQILIPIAIIIFGMIDLLKGVIAQKDEDIKKGQKVFFKRLLAGVLVFLVIVIVKIVLRLVATDSTNIIDCIDCFISGSC